MFLILHSTIIFVLLLSSTKSYTVGTPFVSRPIGTKINQHLQQQTATFLLSNNYRGGSCGNNGDFDQNIHPTKTTTTQLHATTVTDGVTETEKNSIISNANLQLLSERGRTAILKLIQYDENNDSGNGNDIRTQEHIYGNWPEVGVEDEGKKQLAEQVRGLKSKKKI